MRAASRLSVICKFVLLFTAAQIVTAWLTPATLSAAQECGAYLAFTEGDPEIPGDGVYVDTALPDFQLSQPIPLQQFSGGLTLTLFVDPSDERFVNAGFGIMNAQWLQNPDAPCSLEFGAGAGLDIATVTVNGMLGFATTVPSIQYIIDAAQLFRPGCNISVSDLLIWGIGYFRVTPGPDIPPEEWFGTRLDAAMICPVTSSVVCQPPANVFADNSGASGAYEGVIKSDALDGETRNVTVDIQPTVLNLPFLPDRRLRLWASIDRIDFDPDAVDVQPNEVDSLGASFADLRLLPPDTHASFIASFCRAGTVSFTLGFNHTAIALTLADALVSLVPVVGAATPGKVLAFANTLNGIPLYASAVDHVGASLAAAAAGREGAAFAELTRAGKDLVRLALNSKQRAQLRQAFQDLGVSVTLGSLFRLLIGAPVRLIQIFADAIALSVQTGFGSSPIVITLRAAG
jgi:hypothetical protein